MLFVALDQVHSYSILLPPVGCKLKKAISVMMLVLNYACSFTTSVRSQDWRCEHCIFGVPHHTTAMVVYGLTRTHVISMPHLLPAFSCQ